MYIKPFNSNATLRKTIRSKYLQDESVIVASLLAQLDYQRDEDDIIKNKAKSLVGDMRKQKTSSLIDNFLQEFSFSSKEGVILMCLAEALLRIPDSKTSSKFISNKLGQGDWQSHFGKSSSFLVNAATWGMMLTGDLVKLQNYNNNEFFLVLKKIIAKSSEPIVRLAIVKAVKIIGQQFVLAQTIKKALKKSQNLHKKNFNYSYDMLGEAAKTALDAQKYHNAYQDAIINLKKSATTNDVYINDGISVKLSALHPRYELAKIANVEIDLYKKLLTLAKLAKSANIGFNIDAEEADKLELSLSLFEKLAFEPALKDWNGLGFVVQAYQKRATFIIEWLSWLAKKSMHRFMVRLVKGAYWDSEIKNSQVQGLKGFPVFTRKENTDLSYLVCAQKLLKNDKLFYPQFATHNARTVIEIIHYAQHNNFEFQCLCGMGEQLYLQVIKKYNYKCRVYAPVGEHKYLLSYLMRRLLENSANTSFVHLLANKNIALDDLVRDCVYKVASNKSSSHPHIALGSDIYAPERKNSLGINLDDCFFLDSYYEYVANNKDKKWYARAIIAINEPSDIKPQILFNPATSEIIGEQQVASKLQISTAFESAQVFASCWDMFDILKRCDILERAAKLYEEHSFELIYLCQKEAGKTLDDAVAEFREAVDFLRYYASQARDLKNVRIMRGPTGELNEYKLHGRGVFVCISPWNFPLAIFVGQISAALVTGNTVLAKPAEQTTLIAWRAVELLHQAGIPKEALQYLPGSAQQVGINLVGDKRTNGVVFTGSLSSSNAILKTLMQRNTSLPHLIAETGGINAMIVDSSVLFEQVTESVIKSAFQSAGQRCSAVRVLYLQEDIASDCLTMIKGAMAELKVSDPMFFDTDIGPIIDAQALEKLCSYIDKHQQKIIARSPKAVNCSGYYFEPVMLEIFDIKELTEEIFGPVLHIIRFKASELASVIDSINTSGYGLTLGVHSRIDSTIEFIIKRAKVGNIYVNRDTVGAVVGVQPFGGEGLSGTGPKAGGPNYLTRFVVERSVSTNITAIGGNISLLSLS